MYIKIDGRIDWDKDVKNLDLQGEFALSRLEDRTAIFSQDDVAEKFSSRFKGAMTNVFHSQISRKAGPDYDPQILLQVRREPTDLLPIDLKYNLKESSFTVSFDWRTYFCTFLDEQKRMESTNPNPYEAHMGYVRQLRERADRGETDVVKVFKMAIERALPSALACSVNAFMLTRQKRRLRVGDKVHDWLEGKDEDSLDSYSKHGENGVAKKIRDLQMFVSTEEFSDEEEETTDNEHTDSDSLDIWDTTEESDEGSELEGIDEDSMGFNDGSHTTITFITKGKKLFQSQGKRRQQQGAQKHRRQQSSFEIRNFKKARTSQA